MKTEKQKLLDGISEAMYYKNFGSLVKFHSKEAVLNKAINLLLKQVNEDSTSHDKALNLDGVIVSVCDCNRFPSDRYEWEIKANKCFVCGKSIEQTEL